MKQTAVEWLANEIMTKHDKSFLEFYGSEITLAKEIEKQQIIDARNNGFEASGEGWNGEYGIKDFNFLTEIIESEQYYNETFKNK